MIPSTGLLSIHLPAIVANWQLLSARTSSAQCAAVVKADGYGLGMIPVAKALSAAGCQHFFVATLHEAIDLRAAIGQQSTIYVLGGLSHGVGDEWQHYNLLPVLYDIAHIEQWVNHCQQQQSPLPCVLKVDTGMHRLGISPAEWLTFVESAAPQSPIAVQYIMSHLACADEPEHPLNEKQQQCFRQLIASLPIALGGVKCSLANSSGIFLGQHYHFDLVRPGAALYGINPMPGNDNPMSSVVELSLPVMQVRTIGVGESVGYGATFTAQRQTRLATVFGGYADGLFRCLSNLGHGYYKDLAVPLVGRVSMDSLVFDITDLNEDPQAISLVNNHQSVDDLATFANTIGYEVLTSLGQRYQRRYIQ